MYVAFGYQFYAQIAYIVEAYQGVYLECSYIRYMDGYNLFPEYLKVKYFKVSSKNEMEVIHLESMKASLHDLQDASRATESEILKATISIELSSTLNYSKIDVDPSVHNSNHGKIQWPAGSNPSHTPRERKEAESNDGWIRLVITCNFLR